MAVEIDINLYQSLEDLLQYQNLLLLRKIATDKNWDFAELKKKFLLTPTKNKLPVADESHNTTSNFKVIKKKIVKKIVKKVKKKAKTEESKPVKKNRKKKITKSVAVEDNNVDKKLEKAKPELTDDEVYVKQISYQEQTYYWDPTTDKIYKNISEVDESFSSQDTLCFVGIKEGEVINFDAESSEEV